MPIWIVELVASGQLDRLFLLVALMTAPVWLCMLLLPRNRLVRKLASPAILPVFFLVVPLTLLFEAWNARFLPVFAENATYSDASEFARHPIAFLLLFSNVQIGNLFIGTWIYQKSFQVKMRVTAELLVSWISGPVGLLVFVLRCLINGRPLKA